MMGQMAGQSNTILFGGDGPGDMRRMAAELATVSARVQAWHRHTFSAFLNGCCCVQVFKALPLTPSSTTTNARI